MSTPKVGSTPQAFGLLFCRFPSTFWPCSVGAWHSVYGTPNARRSSVPAYRSTPSRSWTRHLSSRHLSDQCTSADGFTSIGPTGALGCHALRIVSGHGCDRMLSACCSYVMRFIKCWKNCGHVSWGILWVRLVFMGFGLGFDFFSLGLLCSVCVSAIFLAWSL